MKRLLCLMAVVMLTGCMFIVRDDQAVKSVGITQKDAQDRLQEIDGAADRQKTDVWPFIERESK